MLQTAPTRLARTILISVVTASWLIAFASAPAAAAGKLIVTISPVYVQDTGGDTVEPRALNVGTPSSKPALSVGNNASTTDWQLNWSVTYLLGRRFIANYTRTNLNYTYETAHNLAPVGLTLGDVHDRIDTVFIVNTPNPHVQLGAGYYHRSRMCCPADGQAVSGGGALWSYGGIDATDYRLTQNYAFGPRTKIGFPIAVFAQEAYANHPIPQFLVPNDHLFGGATYQGSGFYMPTYGLKVSIPTYDRTFVPWISYARNASFLREDPAPVQYGLFQYGFTKGFSKHVSVAMTWWNIKQAHQSFPLGGLDTLRTAFVTSQLNYTFGP